MGIARIDGMDTALGVAGGTGRLSAFLAAIDGVPVIDDPALVKQKSRDFYWYSPILKEKLRDKKADLVVCPRDEADVVQVARACARHRVPLTPRGAGTGNYGQAVPLAGGIVLDMTALKSIEWLREGVLRVGPGRKMIEIDAATRASGLELRMHPSTKRTATIGGFIAGGSGGIGSITYGGLREPGNVLAARIVTLEEEPRILELRDSDALAVNHSYGTTGIITALELPLAPAAPWVDLIIAFPTFDRALEFSHGLALCDGIAKKLIAPIGWPVPAYFKSFQKQCPEGASIVAAMIAAPFLGGVTAMARRVDGTITYEEPSRDEGGALPPVYELTWNHTTLHALKVDRGITYLQSMYPPDRAVALVKEINGLFPDELLPHLEFLRYAGHATAAGLHLIRYRSPEHLAEIFAEHEKRGVTIADPHVVTLEDGTRHKRADSDQLGFKHQVDPYGLMNPGKMRSFVPRMGG
jgi:FAD/FMN-containing dehydrogenase